MIEIRQEVEIHSPVGAVFDTIVDLRGYRRWLTPSAAYPGTTGVSTDPITVGTTYVESGSKGVRHGTITEFQPPTRVTFHQPMTVNPRFLGIIDILVSYAVTPSAGSVHVRRVVTLTIPWPLKLVQPLVVRQFRTESARTMVALKAFAETLR